MPIALPKAIQKKTTTRSAMNDHSRRSFVKTSAATGLTFTFAGLIRAHGQSGGGTTWNPEETFGTDVSTTWNQEATYVATTWPGNHYSTTWDPNGSYGETTNPYQEYTTTFDPNVYETTQPETEATTTEPLKYKLVSNAKGTGGPPPNDPYNETVHPADLRTARGHTYGLKVKYWVNPAVGEGNNIKIEFSGEIFPKNINPLDAAPITTTKKLTFEGDLPDEYTPAMTAKLLPNPAQDLLTATEPTTFNGSTFTGDPPNGLENKVWDIVKGVHKPASATSYSVGTFLTVEILALELFNTLPASATVAAKLKAFSYFKITWFDANEGIVGQYVDLSVSGATPAEFDNLRMDVTLTIEVEAA